ncbi:TPA: nucleotidyltransferase [Methanosarcina acetivorans]|uniref:protein adenylyltransferase n=2 Tax=Methanosarcina acetivorans TaxID=2214 RepID=Q8TUG7_METAC|nr:nucleotidyltransferase [Methanosarcina acetivorans]AAM03554.1 nucleotidyltransferase [Methanosarcina acetivorans C2A]HIH95068.1 nucleotidyltransferase [Methanosarcina acetivorans]
MVENSPVAPSRDTIQFMAILRQNLPEISRKYKVSYLGIFGSYVRGEQGPESDLDILVEFEEAPGFFEYIQLEDYLSEILGVKVDLVMKSALKPAIGKHILEEVVAV